MRSITLYTRDRSSSFALDGSQGVLLTDISGLGNSISLIEIKGSRSRSLDIPERYEFDEIELTLCFGVTRSASGDIVSRPYSAYRGLCDFLSTCIDDGLVISYSTGDSQLSTREALASVKSITKTQIQQDKAGILEEKLALKRSTMWYNPRRVTLRSTTAPDQINAVRVRTVNSSSHNTQVMMRLNKGWSPLIPIVVYPSSYEENGKISKLFSVSDGISKQVTAFDYSAFRDADTITIDTDHNTITGYHEEYHRYYDGDTAHLTSETTSMYRYLVRSSYGSLFLQSSNCAFVTIPPGEWSVGLISMFPTSYTKSQLAGSRNAMVNSYPYWYVRNSSWYGSSSEPSVLDQIPITAGHFYAVVVLVTNTRSGMTPNVAVLGISTTDSGIYSSQYNGRVTDVDSMPWFMVALLDATQISTNASASVFIQQASTLNSVIQGMWLIDFSSSDQTLYGTNAETAAKLAKQAYNNQMRARALCYMASYLASEGTLPEVTADIEIREEALD